MGRNEPDRRLDEAAKRSPELAAMLAGRHDDPSARYRRVATLVGGAVLGVGLLWLAVHSLSPGARRPEAKAFEPAVEIDTSHYLAPIKTQAAGPDEETAPFTGFAISVDTEPGGALVSIAGALRGEAPVLATLACRGTEQVEVRAEKAGFSPVRRVVACRTDTLLKLTLRLEKR
ncbi:MAG TPA: PEGA domain-containing protein [Anaeromyxobacter sp.]